MADEADETWMKEAIGLVGNNNICSLLEISVSQTLARLDLPLKLSPDSLVRWVFKTLISSSL